MMMPKDNKTRNGSGDKGIKTVLMVIKKRDIGSGDDETKDNDVEELVARNRNRKQW